MERKVGWITPLVTELQCFCQRHELGDREGALIGMLAHLHHDWSDVPSLELPAASREDDGRDAEEIALCVVRDVGGVADLLLSDEPEEKLAWSRANLIADLERYASVVRSRTDGRDAGAPGDHDSGSGADPP